MEPVIIAGLPNDIALQCLFRLPFSQIHCLRYVCKAWKSEVKPSELFCLQRSAAYKTQPLFILHPFSSIHCRLQVFDPETGFSSDMPLLPDSEKLPINCKITVVGSKLVVMGGFDNKKMRYLDSVFIFDFYKSRWHCGAKMPDGTKRFFVCAVYDNRTVFVAGGNDLNKTFSSVWTYNVASNKWNQLPDIAEDPDGYDCEGFFYHDKFHVIVFKPGQWNIKSLNFDMSEREWSKTQTQIIIFQ